MLNFFDSISLKELLSVDELGGHLGSLFLGFSIFLGFFIWASLRSRSE